MHASTTGMTMDSFIKVLNSGVPVPLTEAHDQGGHIVPYGVEACKYSYLRFVTCAHLINLPSPLFNQNFAICDL